MKKAMEVYRWLGERYEEFDKVEGRYTGDDYSDIIFEEATTKFHLLEGEVDNIYLYYIKDMRQKLNNFKDTMEKTSDSPTVQQITKTYSKQVKFNLYSFIKQKDKRNREFVTFVNENRDSVFRAITRSEKASGDSGIDISLEDGIELNQIAENIAGVDYY